MSSYGSTVLPFLLVLLTFLTTLPFSHGDSHHFQPGPQTSPRPSPGWESEKFWGTTSSYVEGPITQPVEEYSSVVLAAERTRRKDPLDGFKRYTGGWNISEHHYWASLLFDIWHYVHTSVAADTCVAMNEWVVNPTAHTALDEILPCVDKATAQETSLKSKEVTSQLVDVINEVITNVSNINFAPNFVPLYFNQSGPLVPLLCNPFFHDLTDRPCTAGEVDLNNATQVWANYVCQVSASGICTTTGRLTPTFYDQMSSGVSMSIALNSYGPFLVELEDCTFVRESFNDIYSEHCPALRRYTKWIYIGLAMVSTAVMLSLVFWVIYGRERRHRLYGTQSTADDQSSHHEEVEKD
ncbi:hypothetical protein PanWU01x14_074470 [Parasponia andersonii]|uniref:Transmembrane protein n=1 Tax=Parasponia andersonii TaxID=3476 RepID=A0A2P5DDG6_PARAD|nr:hypothetical protein PanWU01x14_074470 [Parasponia andersonii]